MTPDRTILVKMAQLAERLAEQVPGDVRVTVEFANVPRDIAERYGTLSTLVLVDGTAIDHVSSTYGRLQIEMATPKREATEEERRRLRLRLVDAAVGGGAQ